MPEAVRTVQNDISGEIYMTKDILVRVRGVQTIGEEEDSHLGDFIQDDNVPVPAEAAAQTLLKIGRASCRERV